MRRIGGTTLVLALATALTTAACGGRERPIARTPASTTMTTSAALTTSSSAAGPRQNETSRSSATSKPAAPAPVEVAGAVMRVTMARCDRQAACNNVGTNRPYGDRDSCANEIGHHVAAALSPEQCPSGIDAERLAACMSDVESETCSDKATSEQGPSSCALERLCASAPSQ
jgi:hypothetical protein